VSLLPEDRRLLLKANLERDLEHAREIAKHEREQRDQYTFRIRFGLVAINVALLVTILNLAKLLPHTKPDDILLAAGAFLIGSIVAGYSVAAQQTQLIEVAGAANARAMTLARAVSFADHPVGSEEYDRLAKAIDEAGEYADEIYPPGLGALRLQRLSMALWIAGASCIGFREVVNRITTLSGWIT